MSTSSSAARRRSSRRASCTTSSGVALVDPGPASTLPALTAELERRGISIADIRTILLTHIHLDHAGATGSLLAQNPSIEVYVHEVGAPHMIDPSKLLASARRLYGDLDGVTLGRVPGRAGRSRAHARGWRAHLVRRPGAGSGLHARPRRPSRELPRSRERRRLRRRRRRHPPRARHLHRAADAAAGYRRRGLAAERRSDPRVAPGDALPDALRAVLRTPRSTCAS